MSHPRVLEDVTEDSRRACEARDPQARGSVHPCESCGNKVPWDDLRWLRLEGMPHPVPVHDCPAHPLPLVPSRPVEEPT